MVENEPVRAGLQRRPRRVREVVGGDSRHSTAPSMHPIRVERGDLKRAEERAIGTMRRALAKTDISQSSGRRKIWR